MRYENMKLLGCGLCLMLAASGALISGARGLAAERTGETVSTKITDEAEPAETDESAEETEPAETDESADGAEPAETDESADRAESAETDKSAEEAEPAETNEPAEMNDPADTSDTAVGDVFGAFETKTLDGGDMNQSIFADAGLNMVNIWATYCGPCIREMPELGELAKDYEDEGLQIIGLISDVVDTESDTAEAARMIIKETKADYVHLLLSEDLYYGYLQEVQAVPTTVFVDDEGNQVGEIYVGARDREAWSQIIGELLEEAETEQES